MLKTILVALDESDLAGRLLQSLKQLQLQPTSKIILCHVISAAGSELEVVADLPQAYSEDLPYRHIEKQLQCYQAELPCESELEIVAGDPAEEIIRLAHIHACDLIAIGSRGLKGMKRILSGSVSSQVVADAPCSVFVVKVG